MSEWERMLSEEEYCTYRAENGSLPVFEVVTNKICLHSLLSLSLQVNNMDGVMLVSRRLKQDFEINDGRSSNQSKNSKQESLL